MPNFSKPQVFKRNKVSEGKNYLLSSNKGGVQDMQMATKIIIGSVKLTEEPNQWNRERKAIFHITKS